MKRFLLGVIALFVFNLAQAYEGEPKEQVRKFFGDFAVNTNTAIDNLYNSNKLIVQKVQALTMMKNQAANVSSFFGKFIGYELIEEEIISPSLRRITALGKYEQHPVTWEFYFYKPAKKWIISQALFVDQFQNLGPKK